MKKFIVKVIGLSLPSLLVLIFTNYCGDPAKLFSREYEKEMVAILLSGNYVTNIDNYDERIFQEEIISLMDSAPNIAVFGSSRTTLINSDYFPNQSLFNNSVSGASIEDLIAIYQIYIENNLKLNQIILGVDPWMFNENNGKTRWKSIEKYYNRFFLNQNSKLPSDFKLQMHLDKYIQITSLSYFQSSVEYLLDNVGGESIHPIPTQEKKNIKNTKLLDGSRVLPESKRERSQDLVNIEIINYTKKSLYGLKDFENMSSKSLESFKVLIETAQIDGVEVSLFLCPYPTFVYDKIKEKYPAVLQVEEFLQEYAMVKNLKIYGTFNSSQLNMDSTYFYDGMHCNRSGVERVLDYKHSTNKNGALSR